MLRTLVVRREFVVRNSTALKNHLHNLLMDHYPRYGDFFHDLCCKSSLAFFMRFPSPHTLKDISAEELAAFFYKPSQGKVGKARAKYILDMVEDSGHIDILYQDIRDEIVRSTIRQIQYNLDELERVERSLAEVLELFDCTLTSMVGIDVVSAAQLLSCIGDIRKFSSPAKLARYSGIAPVPYSSGKTDKQFANKRGNRELNSLFYCLSVRLITTAPPNNRAFNPFFYEYYHRKLSEGKTKKQALKCVQRRLVNIIWTMLTHNEEYINPPMLDMPVKVAT